MADPHIDRSLILPTAAEIISAFLKDLQIVLNDAGVSGVSVGEERPTKLIYVWFGAAGFNNTSWTADRDYWYRGCTCSSTVALAVTIDNSLTSAVVSGNSFLRETGVLYAQVGTVSSVGNIQKLKFPIYKNQKITFSSGSTGVACLISLEER